MNHSLSVQISEVRAEIQKRQDVYARLVGQGKMRKAEADYKISVMQNALRTLCWLNKNEEAIREAYGNQAVGDSA